MWVGLALLALLGGCATRPVNPSIAQADATVGYRFEVRQVRKPDSNKENLVILAFSGGGTRAASFCYGVLEFLRGTQIADRNGRTVRLIDSVDLITGVSGGSFTALAYGLYGDKLFDDYETRFLKRDVQGQITSRTLNPLNWTKLWSTGRGRSELASQLYDEILFNGATFGDLDRGDGPMILASATDLSTGARFIFNQSTFDIICSDLNAVPLSRAAAASSAVPFINTPDPPRPAARAVRSLNQATGYGDSVNRPYLHLVDGGVADNLGMRGVIEALEILQALHMSGRPTPLDQNSCENVEQLRDMAAQWRTLRLLARSAAVSPSTDPAVTAVLKVPEAEIYAIDVSFAALNDKTEFDYLNAQPTSFVLPPEAVDRLRSAAGKIIMASPEFQRLLKDVGASVVMGPAGVPPAPADALPR